MVDEAQRRELEGIVGSSHVLVDPAMTESYRTDWTGRFGGSDAVVVRPADTDEVAAVVRWASSAGVALVPQGGNTGLVGASVPDRDGCVVVSTQRLDGIVDLDEVGGQVTVGAGVTPTALAERLAGTGWRFAVDLGARDTATLGGMVATNAGGMRVFRFGSMRAQLRGVEYVAADGSVVSHLGGLAKDNTGFDLASLLCGSEGTLGIVTTVRVRLVPDPTSRCTALLGFADAASAFAGAWALRRSCADLEVIEFVDGPCLRRVSDAFGVPLAVDAPAALLVEAAADADPTERVAAAVDGLTHAPVAVAVASDDVRRAELWRFRDDVTVALALTGPVVKYDVTIPQDEVAGFRSDADAVVASLAPGATGWWFGHVCDENLHLNVTGADPDVVHDLDAAVLSAVAAHRGSISAEHGIGRTRVPYLHLSRSTAEVAQMRAVKVALDPRGILNPGVIFG